jgi:hypothetical protein
MYYRLLIYGNQFGLYYPATHINSFGAVGFGPGIQRNAHLTRQPYLNAMEPFPQHYL